MSAWPLVFDVGDDVRGWGRLVRTPEGDWFEPELPVPLAFFGVRPPSGYAVPVEGADFDAVTFHRESDGLMEGLAEIVGRWLGDRIRMDGQTTDRPEVPLPLWSDPPCAAPPEGWPRTPYPNANPDFDLGDLEETGAAVAVTIFRPSEDQAVVVVAADDVDVVEARLRPQLPDRLCVVPSRWTRAQREATYQELRDMWDRRVVHGCGQSSDEHGQGTVVADVMRVTPEIARWADEQPAGMVVLQPCLTPVRGSRARPAP